jgi:hypothetical protein
MLPFAAVDTKVWKGPFMSIDTNGGLRTFAAPAN